MSLLVYLVGLRERVEISSKIVKQRLARVYWLLQSSIYTNEYESYNIVNQEWKESYVMAALQLCE